MLLLVIVLILGCVAILAWVLEARIFLFIYEKLFYSVYQSPLFIKNIAKYLPGHNRVLELLPVIQSEYIAFSKHLDSIPKAHEVDKYNSVISTSSGPAWRTFYLKVYNGWIDENLVYFPQTTRLFKSMREVTCVMFSVMESGNTIPPHTGKMLGILRYQIPIHLSGRGECTISVGHQIHTYKAGEAIMFDDNNEHSVSNCTDDYRVVLFLDVQKPSSSLVRLLDNFFMWLVVVSPKFKKAKVGLIRY